jgi:hypothetical protein
MGILKCVGLVRLILVNCGMPTKRWYTQGIQSLRIIHQGVDMASLVAPQVTNCSKIEAAALLGLEESH